MAKWSFLNNHARALVCIAQDPGVRLREIAAALEVRAIRKDGTELSLTTPLHDLAGASAGLNLLAPAELQPLRSEYARLSTDLLPHARELQLGGAKESAERQDQFED